MTVMITALAVTALLAGLMVAARISTQNQVRTQASSGLQAWAETMQQPAVALPDPMPPGAVPQDYNTYRPCATPGSYGTIEASEALRPTYLTPTIVRIRYLQSFDSAGAPVFGTTCPAQDLGLQEITMKLTTGASPRPATDTLVVIKRDTRCPATFDNADLGPC